MNQNIFTLDKSHSVQVYDKCIERLVEGTLDGYNATVLAYGQARFLGVSGESRAVLDGL